MPVARRRRPRPRAIDAVLDRIPALHATTK